CIDTSMGFSPLAGLIMGTRTGDIDPSVVFYLESKGYSSTETEVLFNKQSGMLALAGFNDMRDVNKAAEEGNANAILALKMYAYRIQKYIGASIAALNGLDAIIFTAGVGENDALMRKRICTNLSFFNIEITDQLNEAKGQSVREISPPDASIKVLVVPTNEELEIANQCFALLNL
ncbi:MAG: acetate kinase, partial [Bacteroidota bacterium]|nr:acetate kinase [Bacteroidota bacterium]